MKEKSLVDSAEKLAVAVKELAELTNNQKISIIGHSMGGGACRAVEEKHIESKLLLDKNLELLTISAPLSGVRSENHCGIEALHWLSVGILPGIYWLVTGGNWNEITSSSTSILDPNPLYPSIRNYLEIVTNEVGTCRKIGRSGTCIESDYVFNLAGQYNSRI